MSKRGGREKWRVKYVHFHVQKSEMNSLRRTQREIEGKKEKERVM